MEKIKGKRKTQNPCPGCALHLTLCLCDQIPSLDTKTRVSVIIHYRELRRTTNTGSLAVRALKNSEIRVRGEGRVALDLSDLLGTEYQPLLFFPSEDAVDLTPEFLSQFDRPIHLIVPDGNWRQASKVNTRHPELNGVPRVMIKEKNSATQFLRKESSPEGMATLQAIAHALRVIEGLPIFEPLIALYDLKLARTLAGRGVH